jgi:hypothetical protein
MTNNQRIAAVPVPDNHSDYRDRILSDAVSVGPLSEYFEGLQQTAAQDAKQARIDAAQARLARTKRRQDETDRRQAETQRAQDQANTRQALTLIDNLNKVSRRFDAYEAKKEREEQEAIQAQLHKNPDPDDPKSWGDLSAPIPPPETPELELDDQAGFATRPEPDPGNLSFPPQPKQVGQPVSISLNKE